MIDNLTQLSPPAALALGLWFAGAAWKKSKMENWLIPFVLPVLGAILYPLIANVANVSHSVNNPTVFNAIIGFCIGGASIAFDQQIRQFLERPMSDDGKTSFITKAINEKPPSPPAPPVPPAP